MPSVVALVDEEGDAVAGGSAVEGSDATELTGGVGAVDVTGSVGTVDVAAGAVEVLEGDGASVRSGACVCTVIGVWDDGAVTSLEAISCEWCDFFSEFFLCLLGFSTGTSGAVS